MQAYRTVLIVLHVMSAVVGIGATFTFGVLGSLQGRMEGPARGALLEATHAIERRLVNPLALGLLPLTGVLMIFSRGWSAGFFHHTWLWVAILIYIFAAAISSAVMGPGVSKLIEMGKRGEAGTPEFNKIVATQQRLGPVLNIAALTIIMLMVWKPGG